jgi:NTE family protein
MALDEDTNERGAGDARRAIDSLRACSALTNVDAACARRAGGRRRAIFIACRFTLLFDAGTTPDGLYLVIAGRLGVRSSEAASWTAHIGRGELVGELSWLLAVDHSAQVIAIRDSELLWFAKPLVDAIARALAAIFPSRSRACARAGCYQSNRRQVFSPSARIFTIVPNTPGNRYRDLWQCSWSRNSVIPAEPNSSGMCARVPTRWAGFSNIEENNEFVVYLADPSSSAWTRQCCRQADMLLLAANVARRTAPVARGSDRRRTDCRAYAWNSRCCTAARSCMAQRPAGSRQRAASYHHHIVDDSDIERVARLLSHRGVGLVLSGGGARGFAHLGVIRALREARVPIDFVGGASIGAHHRGRGGARVERCGDASALPQKLRRHQPRQRLHLPVRRIDARRSKFRGCCSGNSAKSRSKICACRSFCVSANLTTGRAMQHRTGHAASLRCAPRSPFPACSRRFSPDEAVLGRRCGDQQSASST